MGPSKGSSSKGRVTSARVGKTNKPMGAGSGTGSGHTKRDSATNTNTSGGGSTLKYRSGDVKRSTGSFSKYGK
jgi:hypothetical protein